MIEQMLRKALPCVTTSLLLFQTAFHAEDVSLRLILYIMCFLCVLSYIPIIIIIYREERLRTMCLGALMDMAQEEVLPGEVMVVSHGYAGVRTDNAVYTFKKLPAGRLRAMKAGTLVHLRKYSIADNIVDIRLNNVSCMNGIDLRDSWPMQMMFLHDIRERADEK